MLSGKFDKHIRQSSTNISSLANKFGKFMSYKYIQLDNAGNSVKFMTTHPALERPQRVRRLGHRHADLGADVTVTRTPPWIFCTVNRE